MPLEGVDEAMCRTEDVMTKIVTVARSEFASIIAEIIREAAYLCPVDTGRLVATIPNVSGVHQDGDALVGIIGASTNYAVYVHENLAAHHDYPTQAKFIEIPVKKAVPTIIPRIQGACNAEL